MFTFSEGEYYHIFNRGVEKRVIFQDQHDKIRFQKLLYLCNGTSALQYSVVKDDVTNIVAFYKLNRGEPLVHFGAYCILRNHFHLLIKEYRQGGISQFMQKLSTAYTMYFNIHNERTGALFEGRFRARHALDDDYLKYLFSYVHLNPAEHIEPEWREKGVINIAKIWRYISNYRFSSLGDYNAMQRPEGAILTRAEFPKYFKGDKDMKKEILYWLQLKPEGIDDKRFQG